MADGINFAHAEAVPRDGFPRALRFGFVTGFGLLLASLLAALLLPKGLALAAFGDAVQTGLVGAATVISFRNVLQSHTRERIFWLLFCTGSFLWTISNGTWAVCELWFARPVPDVPVVDVLLFLKIVPLTAAIAIAPDRDNEKNVRSFGLLDVFVLMIYSLYLFAFTVFAYRLLPGAEAIYNFRFNAAAAIGNQTLVVVSGIAALRAKGYWRGIYRLYFFCAVLYALGSNLSNFAIDLGRYYTGSLYDVPLVASLIALVCLTLAGRKSPEFRPSTTLAKKMDVPSDHATFLSEHLAMLVALSTPIIGFWLLSSDTAPPQLRSFRVITTLLSIFLLTLLLSIKQDILAAGLFESLQRLSETYTSIERFKTHLTQSEKLTSLGELVAQVAKQIKSCMEAILEASTRLTSRPDVDTRIQNMAGKIGQYAQRTDVLVDNMLHFAKETPLCVAPLDIKPVLESALHLSRIAKLAQIRVDLSHEEECPLVRGDSSQLLLVFLQLISNAVDALSETQGGTLDISSRTSGTNLLLEFADSGPGIKEPQRVFEPFYTTKPVGKGTGLGLSTCYGIIQQHDGEITCRNRTEGGAIFVISLPIVHLAATEKSRLAEALLVEGAL
jgi:signal transduction histidine kinase